jgi:peroxidase
VRRLVEKIRRRKPIRSVITIALVIALLVGGALTSFAHSGSRHRGQLGGHAGHAGRHRQRTHRAATDLLRLLFPRGVASLDGRGNNPIHPDWGQANRPYARVAAASYGDGVGAMREGPDARYVSNRIFNDGSQNLFSENGVTQWGFIWGQFLDHTFGLRQTGGAEGAPIPFDSADPLEEFENEVGSINFQRTPAATGTGVDSAREQINTVSSYIDAFSIYGGSADRLEWLREGPVDGDLSNNGARLVMTSDGYLPRADDRGDADTAPAMELQGRLAATPDKAVVAGDVRANENVALTSVHTLFAREHNRIVDALPDELAEEVKFQIARRVVIAEMQYITYTEFLPALGVYLDPYRGYDSTVDATLANEFAVVGYRAHSMIHGTIDPTAERGTFSTEELDAFEAQGVEVVEEGDEVELEIPLAVAFGNPDLLEAIGLEAVLAGLGNEAQYRNDEMIDNQLRSVLFQLPGPNVEDPTECLDGPPLPECFTTVLDLGAVDIQRGRDHGIPSYNELRIAYGLEPKVSFADITGDASEEFPDDPVIGSGSPIDDPDILDFVQLLDREGAVVTPGSREADEEVVTGARRTTLASRLKALYESVDDVDAFVGMVAEPHLPGTEFGELQGAIWKRQFEALRDGDRFFYLNDPGLIAIEKLFGLDFRRTLAEIILLNTDLTEDEIPPDVFTLPGTGADPGERHCPEV